MPNRLCAIPSLRIDFAVLVAALFSPLALIRQKNADDVSGLNIAILIAVTLLGGIISIYFWGLWAAFCSSKAQIFSSLPEVSHRWLYFVVGGILCFGSAAYFINKHVDSLELWEKRQRKVNFFDFYALVVLVSYIAFSLWPWLYSWPYGWALARLP